MDVSPNDIRTQEFPTQMRGYAKDEVDTFLDEVAAAMDSQKQENLKLSMEIDSLKTQLAGLRQFEDTIKGAAIDARRNADTTIAEAKLEAEEILSQARTESEELVSSKEERLAEIKKQIAKIELTKTSYLTRMRSLIESHMEIVDEIIDDEKIRAMSESHSADQVDITDTHEIDGSNRETVGAEPEDSSPEPKVTEDANSAHIVDTDQAEPEVDPELKAAMASYSSHDDPPPTPIDENASKPGEFVETTACAEDIPAGFITKKDNEAGQQPKREAPKGADAVLDHKPVAPKEDASVSADELASELDAVAAKFEEEMDRAQQT